MQPPRGTGQTAGVSFVPATTVSEDYSASSSDIRPPESWAERFALTSVGSIFLVGKQTIAHTNAASSAQGVLCSPKAQSPLIPFEP